MVGPKVLRRWIERFTDTPASHRVEDGTINTGWVIAANIAADLTAWTRLLGFCDDADLREADPDTLHVWRTR